MLPVHHWTQVKTCSKASHIPGWCKNSRKSWARSASKQKRTGTMIAPLKAQIFSPETEKFGLGGQSRYISGSSGLLLLILFCLFSSAFCSTTVILSPLTAFSSFFLLIFLKNSSLS